ncbi:MAG: TonB-dependent receptor [Verrucomicrobiota bacterium JB022]|nr:TonB-dependent receptor [Verrucomicrobiota bacterium JB022]
MCNPHRWLSLLALSLATLTPAYAQDTADEETDGTVYELSPFTVTVAEDELYATNVLSGTRFNTNMLELPKAVDVLTSEFIRDTDSTELADVIEYSPSVSRQDSGTPDDITGSSFAVRGYTTFTTYRNGYRSFGVPDTLFMSRIEVIKGPSSVFSGTIEPGGTINIITPTPAARPTVMTKLRFGSYDRFRTEALYSGPLNENRTMGLRLGAVYENYGSRFDYADRERYVLGGNYRWKPTKKSTLTLDSQYVDTSSTPATNPVYFSADRTHILWDVDRSFNKNGPDAFQDVMQWQGNLDYEAQLNEILSLKLGFYWRAQDLEHMKIAGSSVVTQGADGRRTIQMVPDYLDSYSYDLDPQAYLYGEFEYFGLKHTSMLGFEYYYTDQDRLEKRQSPSSLARLDIDNPAPFDLGTPADFVAIRLDQSLESVQTGISFNNTWTALDDKLMFLQGFRYATFEYDVVRLDTDLKTIYEEKSEAVWNFGVSGEIVPGLRAFVSYAESYLPQRTFTYDGDLFDPITGSGWDCGIKYSLWNNRVSGSILGYSITRGNTPQDDPEHPGYSIQSGEDESTGVEFSLQGKITEAWSSMLGYAYTETQITSDDARPQNIGTRRSGIPEHQFSVWNRYRFLDGPLQGLKASFGWVYVGERRGNDAFADLEGMRLPSYSRFDVAFIYGIKGEQVDWNFAFSVKNILDKDYLLSTSGWGEGRTYNGTISMTF